MAAPDKYSELERLWALKQSGAIDEAEFAELKAKALGESPADSGKGSPNIIRTDRPAGTQDSKAGCVIAACVGLLLLVAIGQCSSSNPESNIVQPEVNSVESTAPVEAYSVRLKREVDSLKENPGLTDVPGDKTEMLLQVAVIGARMQLYQDAPAQLTEQEEDLRAEFRRLQSAYQRDAFPKLRKAQAKIFREGLWEQDVEVAATGTRNETLRLTGGIFAANKPKAVVQESIIETLRALRFKRSMYEWYRGSEYTYYDLEPLADGELATLDASGWKPIS